MNIPPRKTARLAGLLAAAALALSGCAVTTPSPTQTQTAGAVVTVGDAWVKAADTEMTAAFGELRNDGVEDVTVVAASTEAAAGLELHETVQNDAGQMVMREREEGFVIPAGGSLVLEPGGDHLMLMGLTAALPPGEEVAFTLAFADGSTLVFTAVVKDYAGGEETYEHGGGHGAQHDHGTGEGH